MKKVAKLPEISKVPFSKVQPELIEASGSIGLWWVALLRYKTGDWQISGPTADSPKKAIELWNKVWR